MKKILIAVVTLSFCTAVFAETETNSTFWEKTKNRSSEICKKIKEKSVEMWKNKYVKYASLSAAGLVATTGIGYEIYSKHKSVVPPVATDEAENTEE